MTGRRTLSTVEEWSIGRRFLEEVWADATAAYWERRARQLDAARPRVGDFNGQATAADLVARHKRLTEEALACRRRGQFIDATQVEFDATLADIAGHDQAGDRAA